MLGTLRFEDVMRYVDSYDVLGVELDERDYSLCLKAIINNKDLFKDSTYTGDPYASGLLYDLAKFIQDYSYLNFSQDSNMNSRFMDIVGKSMDNVEIYNQTDFFYSKLVGWLLVAVDGFDTFIVEDAKVK